MSKTNKTTGIKVTTGIKAGSFTANHNLGTCGVRVRSGVRAGSAMFSRNHNRRLLTDC
jgi:hypothetical protein